MRKRTIRASEIGTYLYCRRTWFYQREGREPENQSELAAGSHYHRQHGQAVVRGVLWRIIAWLLLMAAVVLLVIWVIMPVYP